MPKADKESGTKTVDVPIIPHPDIENIRTDIKAIFEDVAKAHPAPKYRGHGLGHKPEVMHSSGEIKSLGEDYLRELLAPQPWEV